MDTKAMREAARNGSCTGADAMAVALASIIDGAADEIDQLRARVAESMALIEAYGGIDGAHHKTWVIDQVARALTGDQYEAWVKDMKDGEDGPESYAWDEGIAP